MRMLLEHYFLLFFVSAVLGWMMEVTAKLDPPISHEEALAFLKANDGVRRISV